MDTTEQVAARIWAGYSHDQRRHYFLHTTPSQENFVALHAHIAELQDEEVLRSVATLLHEWSKNYGAATKH